MTHIDKEMKMNMQDEVTIQVSKRSYFTLFPVFNRRKGKIEKYVINIIDQSNMCKLNPILKTLIIENVRICCIVVETSGTKSYQILCASAPYMISLLCKANPKLKYLLMNDKISSCLKTLQESDLEFIFSNVYQATLIVQKGAKRLYTSTLVRLVKDSAVLGEKSLLHIIKCVLDTLQSCFYFFYDQLMLLYRSLWQQNDFSLKTIFCNFEKLMMDYMNASSYIINNIQTSIVNCFHCSKKVASYCQLLSHKFYNSSLRRMLNYLYLSLKVSATYLRSTSAFYTLEEASLNLLQDYKPFIWKNVLKIIEMFKDFMRATLPLLIKKVHRILLNSTSELSLFIENNKDNLLCMWESIKTIFVKSVHIFESVVSQLYPTISGSVICIHDFFQTVLPQIIEFSSNAVVSLIFTSTFVLNRCIFLSRLICRHLFPVIKRDTVCTLIRRLYKSVIRCFEVFCKFIIEIQLFVVKACRSLLGEVLELIHVLSPTLQTVVYEINSSVYYASRAIVGKSYLATKRIVPSLWYSVRTVAPPTLQAAQEVVRSSTSSVFVIYPAVIKGLITVRPELAQGVIVLFSDGNKAFLEVITVSYSASCHLKNSVKTVSVNLPEIYKAIYEVLKTTSKAVIVVSSTSVNAKHRMLDDFQKVRQLACDSIVLAGEEIITTYIALTLEFDCIKLPHPILQKIIHFTNKYLDCISPSNTKYNSLVKKMYVVYGKVSGVIRLMNKDIWMYVKKILKTLIPLIRSAVLSAFTDSCKIIKSDFVKVFVINLFCSIFTTLKYLSSLSRKSLTKCLLNSSTFMQTHIAHFVCFDIEKHWNFLKSSVCMLWNLMCEWAPKLWTAMEELASIMWSFIVKHMPELWITWKNFCISLWELITYTTPYFWNCLSSVVPVVWSFIRELIKHVWILMIGSSSLTWHQTSTLTSEYWLLSKTYLPPLWLASCSETERNWENACYVIENSWNCTMKTYFSSWELLHQSIAKSWRSSVVATKTVYSFCSTASSMIKKTFYICHKSKNCICVILGSTAPQICGLIPECMLPSQSPKFDDNLNQHIECKIDDFSENILSKNQKRLIDYIGTFPHAIINHKISASICLLQNMKQNLTKVYSMLNFREFQNFSSIDMYSTF